MTDATPSQPPQPAQAPKAPARATPPTESPAPVPPGPRARTVLLCLLVVGFLFLWNSWSRDFWRPDEPRVAELARSMERDAQWIVPTMGPQRYLDTPPMAAWLPAGLHTLVGEDPRLVYRIPVVLAALLGLWLTFVAGKKLFDGRIGFLALAIQSSTVLYFDRASWLDDDLLFAVSVQLALTSFAVLSRKGASKSWCVLGWLGLAGCALTKSVLLGPLLVLAVLLFFLYFEAGMYTVVTGFRRVRQWRGLLVFLLLVAPWYVFVAVRYGDTFLADHLGGQHIQRLSGAAHDAHPPYYYLGTLAVGLLPWSFFVPLAILHGKDRMARDGQRLCIFWILVMLVALSLVSSKKPGYLLVLWPPFALLIAASFFESREVFSVWESFLREGVFRVVPTLMRVPLFLSLILVVAYFGGSLAKVSADPRFQRLLEDRTSVLWALGVTVAASGLVYWRASKARALLRSGAIPALAFELACAMVFLLFTLGFFNEARNVFQSGRGVLEDFASRISANAPVATYGKLEPEVCYYLGRSGISTEHLGYPDTIDDQDPEFSRIEEFLKQDREVFMVTTAEEYHLLRNYFPSQSQRLHQKAEGPGGRGRTYILLSNR